MSKLSNRFRLVLVLGISLAVAPISASAEDATLILVSCNVDGTYNCGGGCSSLPSGSPCNWCCQTCGET